MPQKVTASYARAGRRHWRGPAERHLRTCSCIRYPLLRALQFSNLFCLVSLLCHSIRCLSWAAPADETCTGVISIKRRHCSMAASLLVRTEYAGVIRGDRHAESLGSTRSFRAMRSACGGQSRQKQVGMVAHSDCANRKDEERAQAGTTRLVLKSEWYWALASNMKPLASTEHDS